MTELCTDDDKDSDKEKGAFVAEETAGELDPLGEKALFVETPNN